jgi:hypothetical protein
MSSQDPNKPPRNADQALPKRQGDAVTNTSAEENERDRDRSAPVPEEETYEREPRNQRPR